MGWVSDPVEQRRQELAIQEAVAECMREAGWEYTPVDWSAQMPETDVDVSDPKAFGEKYGYGVIYNYETWEVGDGDGGPGVVIEDPNSDYVMSLSPEEQEAYYRDLYGDQSMWDGPVDSDDVFVPPPLDQQGCEGKARLEVVGEDPSSDPAVARALEDFYARQQNDPAIEAAVSEWARCFKPALAEYGIDAEPKQIYDGYQIVETEKYRAQGAEVIPVADQTEIDEYFQSGQNVVSAFTDETGAGYVVIAPGQSGDPLPELTGEQIDELRDMELALWKADQACLAESGYEQIQREQEQALVDELLSQFPELGR